MREGLLESRWEEVGWDVDMEEEELYEDREFLEDDSKAEKGKDDHGEDGEPLEKFEERVELFHGLALV